MDPISTLLEKIKNPKIVIALIITGIIGIIVYALFFIPIPDKSLVDKIYADFIPAKGSNSAICSVYAKDPRLKKQARSDPRGYIMVSTEKKIPAGNFWQFRMNTIDSLLKREDILLEKLGLPGNTSRLLSFICTNDEWSREVFKSFTSNFLLYVDEKVDTVNCHYSVAINISKVHATDIDGMISLVRDSACIGGTIDRLVISPLIKNGKVSISIQEIYVSLCKTCPNIEKIKYLIADCKNDIENCQSVYFEQGNYGLSIISARILKVLSTGLKEKPLGKLSLEFHGYTDPSVITTTIRYKGYAHTASLGTLLNHTNQGVSLSYISTNYELSFVRAFSCYDFMCNNLTGSNASFSYTGHGVYQGNNSNLTKRTVQIIIKRV